MKKTLLILGIALATLTSCEKNHNENCGTIINDGISNGCYWLEIENDNTGNRKTFCFDYGVWFGAYRGTDFCVYGEPQW